MNRTNLISPRRRRVKSRGMALRAWACGLAGYAAVLAAAAMVLLTTAARHAPATPAAGDAAASSQQRQNIIVDDDQRQLVSLRTAIAKSQQANIAVASVTDSPDWSRLLATVAHQLGDDVLLQQCIIAPAPRPSDSVPAATAAERVAGPAPRIKPPAAHQVVLHLAGCGRSQAAVADFVLRLEGLDVFQQVQLLQTDTTAVGKARAVSFVLTCTLCGEMEDPS